MNTEERNCKFAIQVVSSRKIIGSGGGSGVYPCLQKIKGLPFPCIHVPLHSLVGNKQPVYIYTSDGVYQLPALSTYLKLDCNVDTLPQTTRRPIRGLNLTVAFISVCDVCRRDALLGDLRRVYRITTPAAGHATGGKGVGRRPSVRQCHYLPSSITHHSLQQLEPVRCIGPQLAPPAILYSQIAAVDWPDMRASPIVLHSSCVCSSLVVISTHVT